MKEEENFEQQPSDKVKTKFVARTPMEAQRIKLEKLMSDPVSGFCAGLFIKFLYVIFVYDS